MEGLEDQEEAANAGAVVHARRPIVKIEKGLAP
jgi:hypothetical protein